MPFVVQSTVEAKQTLILYWVRLNELPQILFYINTLSEMMTATTPFRSSTVDACSQRATKRANAHQRHTRSVQSSSCAEGGFFQSPICIRTRLANPSASYSGSITHILCPAVVVASSPPSEPQLAGHQRSIRRVTRLAPIQCN